MPQVMTGEDMLRATRRISHEILEAHRGASDLLLVGIYTRGVYLAETLAANIESFENVRVPVGRLDVAGYRDDRYLREDIDVRPSDVPQPIDNLSLIIVDDVLYTGRTVRAALDALTHIGRARTTQLAVMVDRGHRELPIRADYVGKNIPTARGERVRVRVEAVDGSNGVWIDRKAAA